MFDFNQAQKNPGKGGEVIAANRKTFPALVSTGSGMALGRVGRKFISYQQTTHSGTAANLRAQLVA